MLGLEPVVRAYIARSIRLRGVLDLRAITDIWPIVVGRSMAERTRPKRFDRRRLEIGVPDSMWASELRFQGEQILKRINNLMPEDGHRIESIRFSVGGYSEAVPATRPPKPVERSIPLTDEQKDALKHIADPELRALVAQVIERDIGRLNEQNREEGTE